MRAKQQSAYHMTISLPGYLLAEIEAVRKDLNVPKSELCKLAIEKFLEEHKKNKLAKIAAQMVDEYNSNDELTAFTSLDSEPFK